MGLNAPAVCAATCRGIDEDSRRRHGVGAHESFALFYVLFFEEKLAVEVGQVYCIEVKKCDVAEADEDDVLDCRQVNNVNFPQLNTYGVHTRCRQHRRGAPWCWAVGRRGRDQGWPVHELCAILWRSWRAVLERIVGEEEREKRSAENVVWARRRWTRQSPDLMRPVTKLPSRARALVQNTRDYRFSPPCPTHSQSCSSRHQLHTSFK